jgi:hypothetical protein
MDPQNSLLTYRFKKHLIVGRKSGSYVVLHQARQK